MSAMALIQGTDTGGGLGTVVDGVCSLTPCIWDVADQAAGAVADSVWTSLTDPVKTAAVGQARSVSELLTSVSEPNTTATWFESGPYRVATILALFLTMVVGLYAILSAARANSDDGFGAVFGRLGLAMAAVVLTPTIVQGQLGASNVVTKWLVDMGGASVGSFMEKFATQSAWNAGVIPIVVVFFLAVATVFGGIVQFVVLTLRSVVVLVVTALIPFGYASTLHPSGKAVAKKMAFTILGAIWVKPLMMFILLLGSLAVDGASGWAGGVATTGGTMPDTPTGPGNAGFGAQLSILLIGVSVVMLGAAAPWVMIRLVPMADQLLSSAAMQSVGGRAKASASRLGRKVTGAAMSAGVTASQSKLTGSEKAGEVAGAGVGAVVGGPAGMAVGRDLGAKAGKKHASRKASGSDGGGDSGESGDSDASEVTDVAGKAATVAAGGADASAPAEPGSVDASPHDGPGSSDPTGPPAADSPAPVGEDVGSPVGPGEGGTDAAAASTNAAKKAVDGVAELGTEGSGAEPAGSAAGSGTGSSAGSGGNAGAAGAPGENGEAGNAGNAGEGGTGGSGGAGANADAGPGSVTPGRPTTGGPALPTAPSSGSAPGVGRPGGGLADAGGPGASGAAVAPGSAPSSSDGSGAVSPSAGAAEPGSARPVSGSSGPAVGGSAGDVAVPPATGSAPGAASSGGGNVVGRPGPVGGSAGQPDDGVDDGPAGPSSPGPLAGE